MPLVRPFVLLGAVLAGLFLTAGVAVASGPYTPGGGQLVLTPSTAAPGDEVTATANGFGANTEVRIVAGGAEAAGGRTDGEGAFTILFTVPDVDAGPLEIRAIGVDGDGATMVLMSVLTVTGDDPSGEPTSTADPSGPADPSATDPASPAPGDDESTRPADPSADPTGPPGEETPDTGVGLGLGTGLVAAAVAAGGLLTVLAARRRPTG